MQNLLSGGSTLGTTVSSGSFLLVSGGVIDMALGVWLIGGVIFSVANCLDQMRPASEHVLVDDSYRRTGEIPKDYEPLKPFLYSADILLPIVDIGQEKFWLPRDAGERPTNAATAFPRAGLAAAARRARPR